MSDWVEQGGGRYVRSIPSRGERWIAEPAPQGWYLAGPGCAQVLRARSWAKAQDMANDLVTAHYAKGSR